MTVHGVCKAIRVVCEAASVVNKVDRYMSLPADDQARSDLKPSIILDLATLGVSSLADLGTLLGASQEMVANTKKGEAVVRSFKLPFDLCSLDPNEKVIAKVEKGLVAPIMGIYRVASEARICESPSEANAQRLSEGERKAAFEQNQQKVHYLTLIEASSKVGAVSSSIENVRTKLMRVATRLRANPQPLHNPQLQQPRAVNVDPFDLLAHAYIPVPLHDDIVLSRYICPITQCPVRFAVKLPNEPHVFERADLERWLRERGRSPTNNQIRTVQSIIPLRAVQSLINYRLRELEAALRTVVEQMPALNIPTNPNLEAAANAEAPM